MVGKDYIVYITYNYDDKTNIIKYDSVLLELIQNLPYKNEVFFFSQLEGKRFLKLDICNPYIFKLVKTLKFPFLINSIIRIIDLNNVSNYYEKDFFYAIDLDKIINSPKYDTVSSAISQEILENQNYVDYLNHNEWVENKLFVPRNNSNNNLLSFNSVNDNIIIENKILNFNNQNIQNIQNNQDDNTFMKIIRIFGNSYSDTLPLNKLHLDDLSIVLSIKCKGINNMDMDVDMDINVDRNVNR